MRGDALVAVDKSVISCQAESQPRGFLPDGRIQILPAKRRERNGKSGVKQAFVAQSRLPAGFGDKLLLQSDDVTLAESFHCARTLYASRLRARNRRETVTTSSSAAS